MNVPETKMSQSSRLDLLQQVADGILSPEAALEKLAFEPFRELANGVNLDTCRQERTGQGEVVFGAGKSEAQLESAVETLIEQSGRVLVTRLSEVQNTFLAERFPMGKAWKQAGLFSVGPEVELAEPWTQQGDVLIISAGASDLPVALEAFGTAQFFGMSAGLVSDVGVAGIHRITPHLETMQQARVHIVVAGMEGALPSVIAGLCGKPVIGVPTSVGYGTGFGGAAALMSMLNSCATGISVVNIDNGFGAAVFASKLVQA